MGKLISFTPRKKNDTQAFRLMKIADSIDAVILDNLVDDRVDAKDVAALLAHRLGTLIDRIDEKDAIWDFCVNLMRKQAKLDKIS